MTGCHVAVSGLIGSGKTTLVRRLAEVSGSKALIERTTANPYFAQFYRDPAPWAFKSFIAFLAQTGSDHAYAQSSAGGVIQERVLREHLDVFGAEFVTRGYLERTDFEVLQRLVDSFERLAAPPDLLIYLEIAPESALERIRERGDPAEAAIELDYLRSLHARYNSFVSGWQHPLLRLDANTTDFRRVDEVNDLATRLQTMLEPGSTSGQ